MNFSHILKNSPQPVEKLGGFALVLKANPYRDERGRFSTRENSNSYSGIAFHGTRATSARSIEVGGFKVGSSSHGSLYGVGVYLAPDRNLAVSYGEEVLQVSVSKAKIKSLTLAEFRKEKQTPEYENFESKWLNEHIMDEDFSSKSPDAEWFKSKYGADGIHLKMPKPGMSGPNQDQLVVFDPKKIKILQNSQKLDQAWFMAVVSKPERKKPAYSEVLKANP